MKCEIIRDLFPSYIDKLTSEESNREIEEHLSECGECKAYLENMQDEEALGAGAMCGGEMFKEDIKPFKKLKRMMIGVVAAMCVIFVAYDCLAAYYTTGVTASSRDVSVRYEKVGNMVTVHLIPKKDNINLVMGRDNNIVSDVELVPIKYHKNPFQYTDWMYASFDYIFMDEDTILEQDGEVKLDGSETITIQFADAEYELRIKELYTEDGVKELEKKLGK